MGPIGNDLDQGLCAWQLLELATGQPERVSVKTSHMLLLGVMQGLYGILIKGLLGH